MLVTAMASGTAADGFTYPKGLYYEVNVVERHADSGNCKA